MRLAILTTHPIQYQAPLFRSLSAQPGVAFTALFCDDHGVRPSFDAGFGKVIRFDSPLLEGYAYRFLRNVAPRPGVRPAGLVNPEIVGLLSRGAFDAVMINGYNYGTAVMALASPRRRTRLLMRGESHLLPRRPLRTRMAKDVFLRAVFSRVDHFLPIGTLNAAYYRAFGVPDERLTLSPYSVDNEYFATRAEAARRDPTAARRRLGLPETGVLFLSAAKLISKKRPFDVLHAFSAVREHAKCALVYVGDGVLAPRLEAEVARLGLGADVFRLGFRNQSELPTVYGACDVLVLPSDDEPWGLVVNEAEASGMAVVASDHVGAAPDLVDPSCVFPARDVDRLGEIMRRLATNHNELARVRAIAAARIARWGISETVHGLLAGVEIARSRPPLFLNG